MNKAHVCPVCRSTKLVDHHDLRECRICTHLFQWPATITAKYDAKYVAKYAGYPLEEISHLRIGFVKAFANGGSLLDVGCGRGDFVRAANKAGFAAWGNDIHGLDVGVSSMNLTAGEAWDVVTFFDSLEHFDSLQPIRSLAARAQLIVVSLPATPATFPANREWRHYRPGEHLHYFGRQSLRRLFSGHALIRHANLEDIVRGSRGSETNIATYVFQKDANVQRKND